MGTKHLTMWSSVLLILCCLTGSHSTDDVFGFGNELLPSPLGVDNPGMTFLITDFNFMDGIVFAFSAYIKEQSRFSFQVWRPVENDVDGRTYALVFQYGVIPTVLDQREDFYIESSLSQSEDTECFKVFKGDRLGLYFKETPGAIPYRYDFGNAASLQHRVANVSDPIQLQETVVFDQLGFPYDFSVLVYLDINMRNYTVDEFGNTKCTPGLQIPKYVRPTDAPTTSAAPITGAPGGTGATGPQGEQGSTGPRGEKGESGFNGTKGDTGMAGPQGDKGEQGFTGPDGPTGPKGNLGDTGNTGPRGDAGATGYTGPIGPPGPQGPRGDLPENFTFPAAAAQVEETMWEDPDMVFYLYIWLAVVTLLLVIVILILIGLCYLYQKLKSQELRYTSYKKDDDYLSNIYDNPELIGTNRKKPKPSPHTEGASANRESLKHKDSNAEPKPEWMNSMKPEDSFCYEVSTIEREASRKNRNKNFSSSSLNDVAADSFSNNNTTFDNGSIHVSKEELVNY